MVCAVVDKDDALTAVLQAEVCQPNRHCVETNLVSIGQSPYHFIALCMANC